MTTAMTGLLILLAIAAPAAAAEPQPKASEDDAAQLKAALDERVKVLTELVDELTAQYRVGTVDVAQVFSAENDLCNALLDSSDEPAKRVALLTKQLDKANNLVKANAQRKVGMVGPGRVFRSSRYASVSRSSCCENAIRRNRSCPTPQESSHEAENAGRLAICPTTASRERTLTPTVPRPLAQCVQVNAAGVQFAARGMLEDDVMLRGGQVRHRTRCPERGAV